MKGIEMKNGLLKSMLVAGSLLALVGCGADKTVDDYQRDKLQQNLSLYQSVGGTYTGTMVSKADKRFIGALQIDLRAETAVSETRSGESALGSPVLVTNLKFLDQNAITLSSPSSYYDPATGVYSSQIAITRTESKTTETVAISGVIRGDSFTGEINSISYPGTGGTFVLKRNGPSITELAKETTPDQLETEEGTRQVSAFTGITSFATGEKKPVHIVLLTPVRGTPEDFLDILTPIKNVQVSFNYSKTLHLLFNGAIYDTRQGLLTGTTSVSVNGQVQNMTLECRTTAGSAMSCRHLTTGSGITASTNATLLTGPSTLPDDSEPQKAITKVFNGMGTLIGRPQAMKLSVTQPSRGRLADLLELFFPVSEKLVNASIQFADDVSMSFMNVKWDSANGILDGSLVGGQGYTAYVQCTNFYFTRSTQEFSCNYWTSRSPNIAITFKPPF